MATKFLVLPCLGDDDCIDNLSPPPRYPSMPRYPKGVAVQETQGSESKAVFSVMGMTCSSCAGSVEKAVKRLPGILEAAVDVVNNRAQVLFYPTFVNVSSLTMGFDFAAALLFDESPERETKPRRIIIKINLVGLCFKEKKKLKLANEC